VESDNQWGMRARLQARAQARWEESVARAQLEPDEVLELRSFAVSAAPLPDEPERQVIVFVLATGRQYIAKVSHERARQLAEQLLDNAAADSPAEEP
jgi:hypothetical protein